MKIYNSLTGKKEEFIPIVEKEVNMYVCGPTVYNHPHIGNIRPVIVFDVIYRYFLYLGYNVKYVSNFTDVDDKIINEAIKENVSEKEVADKYIDSYLDVVKRYNCLNIYAHPRVTEYMEEIINYIQKLIDLGYAYIKENNVYFKIDKVKDYGILSKQKLDNLKDGVRKEIDSKKEVSNDFVLWKKTDVGIKWDSPFGLGRPGWHTECVVMIDKIFGSKIDIHGGGIDLKFPHHENEICQCQAINNHKIANFWLHNGHINIDGNKMSKSLNNFILAKDLLEKYQANVLRLVMLKSNYHQPFNLTNDLLEEGNTLNNKINECLKQSNLIIMMNELKLINYLEDKKLMECMNDDFNTPNLISYMIELIKNINISIRNNNYDILCDNYVKLNKVLEILGLCYNIKEITKEDIILYNKWEKLRKEKNYGMADIVRKELEINNII